MVVGAILENNGLAALEKESRYLNIALSVILYYNTVFTVKHQHFMGKTLTIEFWNSNLGPNPRWTEI